MSSPQIAPASPVNLRSLLLEPDTEDITSLLPNHLDQIDFGEMEDEEEPQVTCFQSVDDQLMFLRTLSHQPAGSYNSQEVI